jgi:prevent-host-death family protein
MKKMALAAAKDRFSEVIEDVERRRRKVLILRHGKPAAAIVPVDDASTMPRPARMTDEEIAELWAGFGQGDRSGSAVEDLIAARGRLDPKG